jgi:hypothetical protein
MTQREIETAHHRLAMEYSRGQITFEQFKEEVKKLDGQTHDHIYKTTASGDQACWCGAQK